MRSTGASHWADENPWVFRIAFVLVLMRQFDQLPLAPSLLSVQIQIDQARQKPALDSQSEKLRLNLRVIASMHCRKCRTDPPFFA